MTIPSAANMQDQMLAIPIVMGIVIVMGIESYRWIKSSVLARESQPVTSRMIAIKKHSSSTPTHSQVSLARVPQRLQMTSLFGKITEETPKFEVLKKTDAYEIRKYAPCIIATTTYKVRNFKQPIEIDWRPFADLFQGGDNGGFKSIAGYIFGKNTSKV